MRRSQGQAAVEVCVLVPLICGVCLAIAIAISTAIGGIAVEHALDRAVIAAARGDDPIAAAREGLPTGLRKRTRIVRRGATIEISIRLLAPISPLVGSATLAGAPAP